MLVAALSGKRIEAAAAERGGDFLCPGCRGAVTLKRGRIVAAHFAHRPPVTCDWARGETQAHLAAKVAVRDGFRFRGLRAEAEFVVPSLAGDRRADVMVWTPGGPVAVELQHQPISFDEIEARTRSYMAAGIPVVWVSFLKPEVADSAKSSGVGLLARRYAAREWERWAHGFQMGQLWFWEPRTKTLREGRLKPHVIRVEGRSWFIEGGDEMSAGGYDRKSKRYRDLELGSPCRPDGVTLALARREEARFAQHRYPGGVTARLLPG